MSRVAFNVTESMGISRCTLPCRSLEPRRRRRSCTRDRRLSLRRRLVFGQQMPWPQTSTSPAFKRLNSALQQSSSSPNSNGSAKSLFGDVAKAAARATASAPTLKGVASSDPKAAFPVNTTQLRRQIDDCSLPPSFELAFSVSQRARADLQRAMNEADASLGDVHFRHDKDGQMSVKAMMIKPNRELAKMYKAVETLEHEALQTRAAMSREVLDLVSELNTAAEVGRREAEVNRQPPSNPEALLPNPALPPARPLVCS